MAWSKETIKMLEEEVKLESLLADIEAIAANARRLLRKGDRVAARGVVTVLKTKLELLSPTVEKKS